MLHSLKSEAVSRRRMQTRCGVTNRGCDRGQTEPLAALVAIAVVCIGVTMYAGYVTTVVPGSSDRDPAEAALEQVWTAIGPTGIFDESDRGLEGMAGSSANSLELGTLPEGFTVSVAIYVTGDDGTTERVSGVVVGPHGTKVANAIDSPASAQRASRPIAVQLDRDPLGKIRGGQLVVEVWQ